MGGARRRDAFVYGRQRRHSAMFHSSLSQPLSLTLFRVFRCAETAPRFTSGIS